MLQDTNLAAIFLYYKIASRKQEKTDAFAESRIKLDRCLYYILYYNKYRKYSNVIDLRAFKISGKHHTPLR